jgi:hypothetical protein
MQISSNARSARAWHAFAAIALLAGAAHAQTVEPADVTAAETTPLELTTDGEPLDLSTPLPDGAGRIPSRAAPAASLNGPLETKLGVNYRKSPIPNAEFQPDPFVRNGLVDQSVSPESTGVAWAHVTAPQLPLGWDSASVDTQLDPLDEQGKISGTLSRSLALGSDVAVTVRNGYSTERNVGSGHASYAWATSQSLRLNLLPTDTTLSVDANLSSGAERWLRSFSAEQKLFGGPFSLSGSVAETSSGDLSKSLRAGFKQNW